MRLIDLARPHLDGVHTVVEVVSPDLDLRPFLSELEDVEYLRYEPDAWETGDPPEITAGTLVIVSVGPDGSRQLPVSAGTRILEQVGPDGRGLMLFGYPSSELPYHRVLDALTAQRCQVLHAATLDYIHLRCGIAFARAGHLLPPRDFSGHAVTADGAPGTSGEAGEQPGEDAADAGTGAADPLVALRIANEYMLADFVSRGLRAHLLDLERVAGAAASERSEAAGLTSRNERLVRELDDARRQLSRADARLAAIERSATWEVGRLLVSAAKNPRRGARMPRQLYRLWQQRGASARAGTNGSAAPAGPGARSRPGAGSVPGLPPQPQLDTTEVPGWGAADGLLAAFTVPGAARPAGAGQLVIAGVLTSRSAATLEGDAVVHPLMPHDAVLMLERTAADLVLIEASALLAGGPWSYAADPAAADRGRLLAGLIGLARGLEKPVVLINDVPAAQLPELGRLASRCDAVTDAGLGVQLARFNPVDLSPDRPCDPVYCGTRSPRERPAQRRLLDELTAGTGDGKGAVRLIGEGSWRDAPALYRRHGLFVAASAAQAHEQLACGARVIGPIGTGGVLPGASQIRDGIDTARRLGPCGVTEIRDTLRGLFREDATPARLAELARLAGLPPIAGGSRQIAVLAMPRDEGEVKRLASAVLRQQHRPSELVVALLPESSAQQPGSHPRTRGDGSGGAALTERVVSAALAEVAASGVAVRAVRAPGPAQAARAVRSPWAAPWDTTRDYPDTHLLDLACGLECSRADAVGYSPGDGYVFSTKIEPALARPGLLAGAAAGPGGAAGSTAPAAAFSSDGWSRQGLTLFAIPG
jgi:hypothetical protein